MTILSITKTEELIILFETTLTINLNQKKQDQEEILNSSQLNQKMLSNLILPQISVKKSVFWVYPT